MIRAGAAAARRRGPRGPERARRGFALTVVDRLVEALRFIGEFVAVLARGLMPGNWRRTMRAEFAFYLYQVGVRAIPVVVIAALLVGIGLVFQVVYWLRFAGQEERIGEVIVRALIRQIAPVGTVLIIIGRSGAVLVEEVGQMTRSGYARALASHGIDPIDLVTIPRAFAVATSAFLLTLLFVHTALWSGYLAASLAGLTRYSPDEFMAAVLGIMALNDYVMLIVKPLLTGYVVGYLSIWFASRIERGPHGIRRALPKAFATSLIATIALGALITALL
ncbi:MAG: ABC transporter permease [Burkholderiales bacterium]|nr:ABC transporter permease [Burkholderiales bacterium]